MNSWNCSKLLKLPLNGLISGNISKKPSIWPSNPGFTIKKIPFTIRPLPNPITGAWFGSGPEAPESPCDATQRGAHWTCRCSYWAHVAGRWSCATKAVPHLAYATPENLRVDQHVFHENCVDVGVFIISWANPQCELAILLLNMAVSVNVPILRKLSNLLSGQWTSPHCTVRIFSPSFEAFAMSRQHGLRNASSFDEETNAFGNTWADRFAQTFDQSKWGWGLKIHGFYTPYFQTHPGGEHVNTTAMKDPNHK